MESNRCGQTMEESSDVVEVIVIPDDPPSSQDITVPSVSSTLSSCSSSSASRVTENSQSLAVHFVSRTDPTDCHMTSGVNKPPQLPMDNRRETQTAGESTVNTSTAIFRPSNVPAFPSSRAPSTLTQATYPMPRGSAASLPANVASCSRPLPLCAVQTDSSSVSMSVGKGKRRKRRMSPGCSNQDPKQPQVASGDLAGKGKRRKRRMSPGCSNQDPKQTKVASGVLAEKGERRMSPGCSNQDPKQHQVASGDLGGTPTDEELEELGDEIAEKWMKLGRRLGVKEAKLQDIKQRYEELSERGYHMLMHWKQENGREATYQILNSALRHKLVQRKDLAEQICYNHDIPDIPKNYFDVNVCQRKLAEHYKRTATVPTSVWSKKCAVNIHEIYTRLSLVKEEQTPAGSSRAGLNHYTDVLTEKKNGLPSNRILVQGETGIGKSTFVKKLAMDWAELDENRLTDEQRAILKKFELAVIIDLKKVSKYQNLRDIISASHIFADEDSAMKDGLLSYITHNQDKVLLVFDGYDEYRFGSNSEIFEIFKGNKLRNCYVLITTRISKADELKEFKDVHAEITGFSKEDIYSFMVRMLGDETQANALQGHLFKRNVYDLAKVPLLLLFFCTLWKEGSPQSFPDSKTKLYVAIVQYVLDHNESKCSPANFRKVEDFKEILGEIGKVALEFLIKDDHVFEYDQLSHAIRICEESRIIGLLQVSEYSENLRPAGMVSFIHKSIQEFLAAWFITYRCVPEGNLSEINDRTCTLDDCRSLENVFQFVCGLSDDGAVKVFEHLKSIRISDPELDLSKTILCDITWKRQCFITLVNNLFGQVQSKTEFLRHYFSCTDGIIFVQGGSVREIIPERRNLNGITLNGVVWGGYMSLDSDKLNEMYESIEFLDCLHVPLRMTENSGEIGEFLRKFHAVKCAARFLKCGFTCILHYRNGQAFFYITRLNLCCDDHVGVLYDMCMTSTPSHSTSSSTKEFCMKFLSLVNITVPVKEQTVKCLVTIFRDCKNLKNISLRHVTKSTCELLEYLPIPRTCGVKFLDSIAFPLFEESLPTSADVMKLAGLLPQINNLISLHLNLNDCCAEAVTKLVFSITHKTLQTLKLRGIALTPDSAAALDRSVSEMSSLYELLIIGPKREPYEIEAPSPTLTSFKSSHFGTGSGWSFVLLSEYNFHAYKSERKGSK